MPQIGIGVAVPKMLPITGTWTLPFTAYLLLLSSRIQNEHYIGDSLPASKSTSTTTDILSKPNSSASSTEPDALTIASRSHANFLENVPYAFILAAVAELNGADRKVLNSVMGALLALRIAHVELGLRGEKQIRWGRPLGYFGTNGVLLGMSGWVAYLVKGYWRF